jgi:F-type H+-transporting ATPase subunit b
VYASGGEGEHHATPFGKDMIFSIINFVILMGLFFFLYRKKGSGSFAKRSLDVKIEMEAAAEAKEKAEAKYNEYKARIDNLDAEIEKIRTLTQEDAGRERESILAEARKQSERMVEQAELTAKQEVESAKRELRREAAELAAGMAEELVKKSMTPEDQSNWVSSYIEKIGETR